MTARLRLRRRLLLFSAPVVVVALVVAVKLITVVVFGNSAVSDFASRDGDALATDASALGVLNVVEPGKVAFTQGVAAALDGDLADADVTFTELLSRADVCAVRLNLELVRETRGDKAAEAGRQAEARQFYLDALRVVTDAGDGCFAGNDDPDEQRRAIRQDAEPRLRDKLREVDALIAAAPVPQPPAPAPPPPPPPPPQGGRVLVDVSPDRLPGSGPVPDLRLDPGGGTPLERLRESLGNSTAAGQTGP